MRRIFIQIGGPERTPGQKFAAALSAVAALAGGALLCVLLLPALGILLAIALGVAAFAAVLGAAAVLILRWKLRRMIARQQQASGDDSAAPRPSKRINVTIRQD
ncbi:MAG TPA: hypothetical protein PK082_08945 [Phycisphaerae bacterium]|nr:hypothetical protein [Phycisphaerae bacterium]